jgi:hypothetical protein
MLAVLSLAGSRRGGFALLRSSNQPDGGLRPVLKLRSRSQIALAAMSVAAMAVLGFAGSASAEFTPEYVRFQFCPYKTAGVDRCVISTTEGGEVKLGSKAVPIVNPVTLQGGYTEPAEEGPENGFAKFVAATNGITLSKGPQPVPGGLLGLVPPEGAPPLVKAALKLALENGLTGVNSTLELARPASEIRVSEGHLAEGIGVAFKLPLKVHLENPLLGSSCYIGSSTTPVMWELTSGETHPPGPNGSISGTIGSPTFLDGGFILKLDENVIVDNAWSAPAASGCGGILSALIDPIIALQLGSTEAGHNTAILENTVYETTTFAVNNND